MILSCAAANAAGDEYRLPAGPSFTAPCIKDGLKLTLADRKVSVSPGQVWVNDKLVSVKSDIVVDVPPCPIIPQREIPLQLVSEPNKYPGLVVRLSAGRTSIDDTRAVDGELDIGSIRVKAHPGDKIFFKPKTDWLYDKTLGTICRVATGAIQEKQKVYVDCAYKTRRLDTLVVNEVGIVKLVVGTPTRSAIAPAPAKADELALANIYAPYGSDKLQAADFLPIQSYGVPLAPLPLRKRNHDVLVPVMQKLDSGQPVTIIFWGDSITGGADASAPERNFANLVVSGLRQKYPRCRLKVANLGVGGSNTVMRMPRFEQDVIGAKPDLIVVEFINDVMLKKSDYESNYRQVISKARESGSAVLLVNPSMPSPELLGVSGWAAAMKMPYYSFIRQFSHDNNTALADVEARWESVGKEGLTPALLLSDHVIHPNDLGHLIYSQEILKCFQ